MNNKLVIPLIILVSIGLYFIGSNITGYVVSQITGYVVSQDCCYPPNCEPENMCNITKQNQRYSASLNIANYAVYIGEILILVSILTYVLMYRKDNNS